MYIFHVILLCMDNVKRYIIQLGQIKFTCFDIHSDHTKHIFLDEFLNKLNFDLMFFRSI